MVKKKTTKTAKKGTRSVGGTSSVAPQRRGVKPRKRRNVKGGLQERFTGPPDDRTLKSPSDGAPEVSLVRPSFTKGHIVFRPLPAWNPELWEEISGKGREARFLDPYRMSQEPNDISDILREYAAVSFWGDGDEAITFLLYDKDWGDDYDPRSNPAIIIWNAVYRAVEKDFTHPEWGRLMKGHRRTLSKPVTLSFMQGLVFRNIGRLYIGKGKMPRGLGKQDKPQIIQLKQSAGRAIKGWLNALNEDWTGDPDNFGKSMLAGDVVSPEDGTFITVYNHKQEQLSGESLDDVTEFGMEAGEDAGRIEGEEEDRFTGYSVRLDPRYMHNGKPTQITPALQGKNLEKVLERLVWFDDVINMPSSCDEASVEAMHAQQCLWLARALRGYSGMLEFAWADKPEFFTEDVNKVLANAVQVSLTGAIPDGEDDLTVAGEYGDAALETPAPSKTKRRRSQAIPEETPEAAGEDESEYVEVEGEEPGGEEPEGTEYEEAEGEEPEGDEYEEAEGEEPEEAEGEYADVEDGESEGEEPEGDDEREDADAYEDADDDEYEYVEVEVGEEGAEEELSDDEADMKAAADAASRRSSARDSKVAGKKKKKTSETSPPKKKTAVPKASTAAPGKKAPVKKVPIKKTTKGAPKKRTTKRS